MTSKAVLVDGSSILYRAFFAMPHLSTAGGTATGAILGTATMLLSIVEEEQPAFLGVFFDRKAATYRHEMFSEYKANRESMPEELVGQLLDLKELIAALGIVTKEKDGFEADDFIGIYSREARSAGIACLIYSGDNDLLQLADENTTVRITVKGVKQVKEYSPAVILQDFGVRPPQLVDVKALRGDPSDNIPGVRGIGEKTALKLIGEYGSIDALLLDGGPERYRSLLAENRDLILRNRELVTIQSSLDEQTGLPDLERHQPDEARLGPILRHLALQNLAKRVNKLFGVSVDAAPARAVDELPPFPSSSPPANVQPAATQDDRQAAVVAPEADGTGCTITIHSRHGSSTVHSPSLFGTGSALPVSTWGDTTTYVYDSKKTVKTLEKCDLRIPANLRDIMLSQYLLDPDRGASPLDQIAAAYGLSPTVETADAQAELIHQLSYRVDKALEQYGLEEALLRMEMPFAGVLARMELAGIRVDTLYLRDFGAQLGIRIAEIERQAYDLLGTRAYSLQSPKQLGVLLYDVLGLAPSKRTKTGLSTDVESLTAIRDRHPVVPLILELRQLTKIKGTYADALVRFVEADGRIHPTFLQTGTSTGRLSCVDPNLQNIPVKTEAGRQIQRAFLAGQPGGVLISADYSQIDLRMLAHLSGDENLSQAFLQGEDIHLHTASQIFGVDESAVTPEMRKRAKTINFGIVYGISPFGLSRQLGITGDEAASYIARYLERFPGIGAYHQRVISAAERVGYVTTILGRLRRVPHIGSPNNTEKQEAVRQGFNAVIQGSSADVIKMAMIHLAEDLRPLRARMVLQIHDEIILDCPASEMEVVKELVKKNMESALHLSIPLVANVVAGPNLRDLA
jgi:DNA polymerase-1